MAKKIYAVKKGRKTGVYETWDACKAQVDGFGGAEYKSFPTKEEAVAYLNGTTVINKKTEEKKASLGENTYIVYSDGSFVENQNYSYAFAVIDDKDELIYKENGVGNSEAAKSIRNVAGELVAVIKAVEFAKKNNKNILIHYDYQGVESWATGAWKANNPYTQWYAKFMQEHKGIYAFVKVKAHSGEKWNEFVDKLAKEALGI